MSIFLDFTPAAPGSNPLLITPFIYLGLSGYQWRLFDTFIPTSTSEPPRKLRR